MQAAPTLILITLIMAAGALAPWRPYSTGGPTAVCRPTVEIRQGERGIFPCTLAPIWALAERCPPSRPLRHGDQVQVAAGATGCRLQVKPMAPASALSLGLPLYVGERTVAELTALSGVGVSLARALKAQRPLRREADLLKVKGMGPARLRRLRPHLRLRPLPRLPPPPAWLRAGPAP